MTSLRNRFEGRALDNYGFVRKDGFKTIDEVHRRRREQRWELMYGQKNFTKTNQLKRFCRKGVPRDKRVAVWLTVSNTEGVNYEQSFQSACRSPCQSDFKSVIFEDLRRTFPDNSEFHGENSEALMASLKLVLEAFASFRPDPGYCQGKLSAIYYIRCAFLIPKFIGSSRRNGRFLIS